MNHSKWFLRVLSVVVMLGLLAVGVSAADTTLPPTVEKWVSPTDINIAGTGAGETTTVTIRVTGAGGTTTTITPMDVVFALDSSGSMSWNDPGGQRKIASKSFVDKMEATRDQGGVVSWDSKIDFTQPLTNDFPLVKTKIDAVDSSGGTNLNVGLFKAIELLDTGLQSGAAHVIIFLTDGEGTYTYGPTGPAADAASKGYVVYSILLAGSSGASAPLIDMATVTGGQYFSSPSADNLQTIFDTIYDEVVSSTIPHNVDVVEVTQGYIVDEGSFNIAPNSVVEVLGQTVITWNDIGLLSGDSDSDLTADEVVTLTFEAKSNMAGLNLPVQDFGNAIVNYDDADGAFVGTVDIPQAYINVNTPPDCTQAAPSVSQIWPPNHKFVTVSVLGITDPDGDPLTFVVDSIYQDEPVDTFGDGKFTPDGQGVGTATADVRAERSGTKKAPGDGRVYHITYTAMDPYGETCTATVQVGVPHDVKDTPVDGGALYDSTVP